MRSQAMSIAEKTTGNTVFSIGTDFEYNSEDDDGSEEEKNSPRGQILFEGLDLLNRTKEKGNERNDESSEEQSKNTVKEDLEYKMEQARRGNEMIDSEDEEYQDARESDDDGDDEEWESTSANNQLSFTRQAPA
jgi:CRISPR/Cas system-associated protein Cas10 (large subunit of type III CRISPR-Cas system)